MKQSKVDFKGIVLCENFGDKFSELVYKEYGYDWTLISSSEFDDYLRTLAQSPFIVEFISDEGNYLNVMLYIECCFLRETYYEFKFYRDNKTVDFTVYNNSYETIYTHTFEFENGFESLFAFPQIEEKTTSEPKQPVDDAEEQENPEQTEEYAEKQDNPEQTEEYAEEQDNPEQPVEDAEAEDNPELTPLERAIFEAFENSSNLYVEYICKSLDVMKDEEIDEYGCYSSVVLEQVAYFHELASIEDLKTQFLLEIISKAGLDETYQSWLAERKKQEAVTVI